MNKKYKFHEPDGISFVNFALKNGSDILRV